MNLHLSEIVEGAFRKSPIFVNAVNFRNWKVGQEFRSVLSCNGEHLPPSTSIYTWLGHVARVQARVGRSFELGTGSWKSPSMALGQPLGTSSYRCESKGCPTDSTATRGRVGTRPACVLGRYLACAAARCSVWVTISSGWLGGLRRIVYDMARAVSRCARWRTLTLRRDVSVPTALDSVRAAYIHSNSCTRRRLLS